MLLGAFLHVSQVTGASTAEIIVDTLDDEIKADGDCSLREAIYAANQNIIADNCSSGQSSSTDTIRFEISGTIFLSEQLLVSGGGPLVIDGGDKITISGDDNVRVFYLEEDVDLTLQDLSVIDGSVAIGFGGGLHNNGGRVTIVDSNFSNHQAGDGGGIHNTVDGQMVISNSILSNNMAENDGGGIHNTGALTITGSTISNNLGYEGSGIYNEGVLIISNSQIFGNGETYVWGGGIYNYINGKVSISDTKIHNNKGTGAGIRNAGTISITNSMIYGNKAELQNEGGGISNGYGNGGSGGTVTITYSSIFSNTAHNGGGIRNDGTLTIADSTIFDNSAEYFGGGIDSDYGKVNITNSTLSFNDANYGGTIDNYGSSIRISNCTFSANSAVYDGGVIFNHFGPVTITNSIVAASLSGDNCSGTIIDGGHNIDDGNTCGFIEGANTNPLLGTLQDNGGPTLTHDLLPGSPAIDSADPEHCLETDQRGAPRPFDGNDDGESICDIGAVEFIPGGFPFPTTTTINTDEPDPSQVNQPFTVTFSVTSTFEVPTGVVSVTVSDTPDNCNDTIIDGSGSCQLTITDTGTYTLTAYYNGNATYSPSIDSEVHIVSTQGGKLFFPLVNNDDQP
jgi:CSLREA domain-containing protein